MQLAKLNLLISKRRIKAIVKVVAGRRMLFGFERLNKRSRKYHVKHLSKPIDLASLSPQSQKELAPASSPTIELP
jgi:hypothetical protein